jgi:hypothetical protein
LKHGIWMISFMGLPANGTEVEPVAAHACEGPCGSPGPRPRY